MRGKSLGFSLGETVGQWRSDSRGLPRSDGHFNRIALTAVRRKQGMVMVFPLGRIKMFELDG